MKKQESNQSATSVEENRGNLDLVRNTEDHEVRIGAGRGNQDEISEGPGISESAIPNSGSGEVSETSHDEEMQVYTVK